MTTLEAKRSQIRAFSAAQQRVFDEEWENTLRSWCHAYRRKAETEFKEH
jgi:hypothetical protein